MDRATLKLLRDLRGLITTLHSAAALNAEKERARRFAAYVRRLDRAIARAEVAQ